MNCDDYLEQTDEEREADLVAHTPSLQTDEAKDERPPHIQLWEECECGHDFEEHEGHGVFACAGDGAFPGTRCSCPEFEAAP